MPVRRRFTLFSRESFLLLLLIIFHSIILVFYVSHHMHGAPLFGDEADKISQAAKYYFSGDMEVLDGAPYPPLLYFTTQPLFKCFGVSKTVAVSTNIIFIILLVVSTFWIAMKLAPGTGYGLLAAGIVMVFPGTIALSRIYYQDFANIAMTSTAMAFLLASRGFTSRKWTLAFGLVSGLGMLTRGNFCIFLFGPAAGVLAMSMLGIAHWGYEIAPQERSRMRIIFNVALGFILSVAVASIWYLRDYPVVINFGLQRVTLEANAAEVVRHNPKSIFFYLYSLIDYQISELLFIPVAALGIWGVARRFTVTLPLLLCILVGYLVFVFPEWKLARYVAPMLPAFAVLLAVGAASVKCSILRVIIIIFCILTGTMQYAFLTFPSRFSEEYFIGAGRLAAPLLGYRMGIDDYQDDIPKPISNTNFHIKETGEVLREFMEKRAVKNKDSKDAVFNPFTMSCFAEAVLIPDEPGSQSLIDCGYEWPYVSAVYNLNMRVIQSYLHPDGKVELHPSPDFIAADLDPGNSDIIACFDPKLIEIFGLQDKYDSLGSWHIAGNGIPMHLYGKK